VSPQYIGVASSSSQFFRQIGSVMGIAIFGVILAHTYRGELADRITPEDRSAIEAVNPAILVDLEDPTLRLNEAEWAAISGQIAAVAGGEGILARASRAQDEAVSVATQNIFTVALVAALLSAAFALAMRELPLRRGAQRVTPAVPVATAGAAGATTDAPGQAPVPEPGPGGGGS
jgi:peptidoglycan/LPS O-acetylase OafA/YrhL